VVCSKVESPDLRRLEVAMRKKAGLTNGELRKLANEAPCEP
jgi:hypothetical protein